MEPRPWPDWARVEARGLWVAPVDYPAVPLNRVCFRACVTAKHTRADLDEALKTSLPIPSLRLRLRAPDAIRGRFRMSEQLEPAISTLEGTYKARDVEGILDLLFYRRVAFRLAQFCARLKLTPVTVTVFGGICGSSPAICISIGICASTSSAWRFMYLPICSIMPTDSSRGC